MTYGEKLRRLRGSVSLCIIGEVVGCSGEHIRRLEQNKARPNIVLALSIARYYGVSLDWMADNSQNWPPQKAEMEQVMGMLCKIADRIERLIRDCPREK